MPLYEYECKKCGHRFEKIQKFSDKMVKKCPECGGQVEQMISAPAVQFKGTGWYVTDYAKKVLVPGSSGNCSIPPPKKRRTTNPSRTALERCSSKEGSSKETSSKDSSSKEQLLERKFL